MSEQKQKMKKVYLWLPPELIALVEADATNLPAPYNTTSNMIRTIVQQHYDSPTLKKQ